MEAEEAFKLVDSLSHTFSTNPKESLSGYPPPRHPYDIHERDERRSYGQQYHGTFRFMDLPAEIRNMVYRLVVQRAWPQRLRSFIAPAITCIAGPLGDESLPIFFDVNTFVAEVKAPYYECMTTTGVVQGFFLKPEDARYQYIGKPNFSQKTISLFSSSKKNTVRIKNLDFVVLQSRNGAYGAFQHLHAIMSLRIFTQPLQTKVSCHIKGSYSFDDKEQSVKNLEHVMAPATAFLQDLISKPGFKGLEVTGLKKLANTLRVGPRPDACCAWLLEKKSKVAKPTKKVTESAK